jgi:hypothetical protein
VYTTNFKPRDNVSRHFILHLITLFVKTIFVSFNTILLLKEKIVMKRFIAIALVLVMVCCIFAGCEDNRIEVTVMSCEEGTPFVNGAAKVQATMNFANGKYTNAMVYGAMAKPQARFNTVVEYDGVEYEIATSKSYEVGEVIKIDPSLIG